jgi:hypothetical protein
MMPESSAQTAKDTLTSKLASEKFTGPIPYEKESQ